jgi:hypothetical protein
MLADVSRRGGSVDLRVSTVDVVVITGRSDVETGDEGVTDLAVPQAATRSAEMAMQDAVRGRLLIRRCYAKHAAGGVMTTTPPERVTA